MSKFIKVTELSRDHGRKIKLLNLDTISSIEKSNTGPDTHVKFKDLKFIFIDESIDDVWRMIKGD